MVKFEMVERNIYKIFLSTPAITRAVFFAIGKLVEG